MWIAGSCWVAWRTPVVIATADASEVSLMMMPVVVVVGRIRRQR
jgi:hypothetical protein